MRTVTVALFSFGLSFAHVDDCTDWLEWVDDFGWACKDYLRLNVCDVPEQAGTDTAHDACCHCGGGSREPEWSRRRLSVLSSDALRECRRECSQEYQKCSSRLPSLCTEQKGNCENSCRDTGAAEICTIAGANSCLICVDGILTPDQEPTEEPTQEPPPDGGDDFPWYWLLLLLIPLCCIPLCILLYCMMRPIEEQGTCPPQQLPQDECDDCDQGCNSPLVAGCATGDCEGGMIPAAPELPRVVYPQAMPPPTGATNEMVGLNAGGGYPIPQGGAYGVQQAPGGYGQPGYGQPQGY